MNHEELLVTERTTEDGADRFYESLIQKVESFFPEGAQVQYSQISKNNGVFYKAICIREPGTYTAPAIHVEQYYKQFLKGAELEDIVKDVIQMYEENKIGVPSDMSNLCDYEWIKERLGIKLVNYEQNREMLKKIPHIPFLNLAITVIVYVDDMFGTPSTFVAANSYMDTWEIEKGQIIKDAMENAVCRDPAVLYSMDEVLRDLAGEMGEEVIQETKDMEAPMYVLTNSKKHLGASCVLYHNELKKCAKVLGKEFYILPSSIHEQILIPGIVVSDPEELTQMVRDVNRNQVLPMEKLSDHIYKYDADSNIISLLGLKTENGTCENTSVCLNDYFDKLLTNR